MSEWKSLYLSPKSTVTWEACCASIICACQNELIIDSQDEPTVCECGRTYRLISNIQYKEDHFE